MRDFCMKSSTGPAILLLHGLTGAPAEMHPIGKMLHRAGCTVKAPLLAGHGGSRKALLSAGWRDWLASAEQAYDDLARDHERVHVGGICLGAMLAVALAARRPVAGIAAYGTTFRYDGWSMPRIASHRLLMMVAAGLPGIRRIGVPEREPYGLKDEKMRALVMRAQQEANGGKVDTFPLGAIRQLYRLADHVDKIAPQVDAPTLIVHAREDDTSSIANAYRLRDRLNGETRLELLDDSYHLVHLDRQMDQVAGMTAEFFGLSGASRSSRAQAVMATV